jgi:uncharacterized membrane protein YkoI
MDRLQASVREHASSLHHAARTGPERGIHEPFSGPEVVVAGMRLLAVVLLACALAAAASPAWPASFRGGAIVAPAESVQPLGQVLRRVNERYPGRALDAELFERAEPQAYRIKWLGEDGKVREVTADARTGRIIEVR